MKTLLATASASVLLLAAAACSDADAPYETAGYDTDAAQTETVIDEDGDIVETADANMDVDASTRTEYTLAQGEMEASDLIGASVHGPAGEQIAVVADIYLGEGVDNPKLIVRDGGVAGVGGELRIVEFDGSTVTQNMKADGDEPDVIIQQTGESLEMLPEFEQEGLNDYRLASEMIGTGGLLSFSGDSARIEDIILAADGQPRYAVLSDGMIDGDKYLVDASAVTVAEGDGEGEWVINIEQEQVDAAPRYTAD